MKLKIRLTALWIFIEKLVIMDKKLYNLVININCHILLELILINCKFFQKI